MNRKAESSSKYSETHFSNVLDNLMEGCQIIDFNWKYLYLNPSAAKQGRFSVNELVGKTMMEAYPGIENTELFDTLKKCMKDRKPKFMENKFTYNDGNVGYFELRIEPVNEGLFILSIDISERKKAEEKIQKLNEELEAKVLERTQQLEATNKELESFCYSVSHDLRAPLRAVDGYAGMLVEDYTTVLDNEGLRLLNNVQYNAKKMGTLIDDLLAFSRIGKKEVQRTEINMNELVEGVFIEYQKTAKLTAEVIIKDLHPNIADYALIHQVFSNLISNAFKYSSKKEKPVVEISSKKEKDQIVYSVKDNGAGFNMRYANKLFGVFQRLHTVEEFEGTGVGLAIVQRIINKHGGKVWATAEVDKGAIFSFSLPKI